MAGGYESCEDVDTREQYFRKQRPFHGFSPGRTSQLRVRISSQALSPQAFLHTWCPHHAHGEYEFCLQISHVVFIRPNVF